MRDSPSGFKQHAEQLYQMLIQLSQESLDDEDQERLQALLPLLSRELSFSEELANVLTFAPKQK
ncbi:MAG: hypothetical protein ACON5C_03815 [Alphaproteobacteria bacterium]